MLVCSASPQQWRIWFIFWISYHRCFSKCFSTSFLMEIEAKYEHSLILSFFLRRNVNKTATSRFSSILSPSALLRRWVLENNPVTKSGSAAPGPGKATGDSGGRVGGQKGVGGCSNFSTPASPSFQGPLYLKESQSWLTCQNQLGSLCVCLKRTCTCILTFYF